MFLTSQSVSCPVSMKQGEMYLESSETFPEEDKDLRLFTDQGLQDVSKESL